MGKKSLKNMAAEAAVKAALLWIDQAPVENMLKLLNLLERFDTRKIWAKQLGDVKRELTQRSGVLYDLVIRGFRDVSSEQRMHLAEIFIFQVLLVGNDDMDEVVSKYHGLVPWTVFPFQVLTEAEAERIISHACMQGVHLFVIPYVKGRERDLLLSIAARHQDCAFIAGFVPEETDPILISELKKLKNLLPVLPAEKQPRECADAMRNLLKERLLYGADLMSVNAELIDRIIADGAGFALYCDEKPGTDEDWETKHRELCRIRTARDIMTLEFRKGENGTWVGPEIGLGNESEPCITVSATM